MGADETLGNSSLNDADVEELENETKMQIDDNTLPHIEMTDDTELEVYSLRTPTPSCPTAPPTTPCIRIQFKCLAAALDEKVRGIIFHTNYVYRKR